MRDRKFFVEGFGNQSYLRSQRSGISQGCTLSPLIFITVMSALMADSAALLAQEATAAYQRNQLADIACADDTLLSGASAEHVEEFLHCREARAGLWPGATLSKAPTTPGQLQADVPPGRRTRSQTSGHFDVFGLYPLLS